MILVKKKVILLLIIILLIAISTFLIIIIPSIKDKKYKKDLLENIYKNTKIEKINYLNKYNNYYIIKIDNKAVVFP